MSIPPPSELQFIPFPPFGLKWYATPPPPQDQEQQTNDNNNNNATTPTCTAFAICGGGGAAKTGFANCIHIVITLPPDDAEDDEQQSYERTVDIDTGSEVGVGVTLHQVEHMLWVLVAIGNGFALYFVPLLPPADNKIFHGDGMAQQQQPESVCMAEETFGEETTCEAVAFMPDGSAFATGYENGKIRVFTVTHTTTTPSPSSTTTSIKDQHQIKVKQYCELHTANGCHIKAIDTLQFHPSNPRILASCAKDGTARIWDLELNECIDVLNVKIYPSNKPPPDDTKITNPKPGQLLVRGCAFGDPSGGTLYTVQSGRRGCAYLSVWQLVLPPMPPVDPAATTPPSRPQPIYQEILRKEVAPVPISAMSLSGDYRTLALGNTAGTVTLHDTANGMKVRKSWVAAHETPVTCIAARPYGRAINRFGEFSGEDRTGVTVDVMTASFDNKLLFLTKMKKSRLAKPGPGRGIVCWGRDLTLVIGILLLIFVSLDVCWEEMMVLRSGNMEFLEPAKDCLVHTVFWAKMDRVGVSEVPM